MQEQVKTKIEELESEYRAGEDMLARLDGQRAEVRETVLRISGAIQVLRELLDESSDETKTAQAPKPVALAAK